MLQRKIAMLPVTVGYSGPSEWRKFESSGARIGITFVP